LLVLAVLSQFRPAPSSLATSSFEALEDRARERDLNVVLILIDTLRADRLGAWGYERPTSPNLDRLSRFGVRFARVEAQSSWTKASMASLWTAFYPERTGVLRFGHALPDEAMMPAEILKARGYRTAGLWRNGWVANNFGFGQGFDLYHRPAKRRDAPTYERFNPSAHPLQGTDLDATESAIEFLRGVGDDPFLLYVHYMDVHQYLYADSSPSFGTSFSDIYDAAIHWTDRNVGMLLDALDALGHRDRTIVVVASDHGEAFHEHGVEGHARNLYREVVHTPLVIGLPFALEEGVVVEERVANIDLWPTLFDLLGAPAMEGVEGRSLVPLIRAAVEGKAEAGDDRTIFSQLDRRWGRIGESPDPLASVSRGDHRLIEPRDRPEAAELYDRARDPRELRNLAAVAPGIRRELMAELEEFYAAPPVWGEAPEVEIDALRAAQLRALGYAITPTGRNLAPRDGEGETIEIPRADEGMRTLER
jgi:arylsulfatase A-like enzyme